MKNRLIEFICFIPFLAVAYIIGLYELITGASDQWHTDYVDSNQNHGQGPRRK